MKAVVYDHQRYECVGTEPYTRLNGTPTTLEIWQSHCVTCGQQFRFKRASRAKQFYPNRRCPAHRRRGVRLSRRERQRLSAERVPMW